MDVRPVRRTVAIHRSNGVIDAAGVNVNPETEAERGGKIAQKDETWPLWGRRKDQEAKFSTRNVCVSRGLPRYQDNDNETPKSAGLADESP
jgi:hypothetical protein